MKFVAGYVCIIFTQIFTPTTEAENCATETQDYLSCVYDAKKSIGLWRFRRPYADHANLNRCFSLDACSKPPDYKQSMFRSFLKFWQDVSVKTWDEFLKSPDSVRICMNKIVGAQSKDRIDSCLKNNGFEGLPDSYTEDFEVPYCMLQTNGSGALQAMKVGIQEKAAVIHELHECKKKDGVNTSKRTIFCIDDFRANFTRINFCPISDACKRQKVSNACSDNVRNSIASACACTRAYRNSILNKIDVMYRSGSLNILKLAPAFLGLDLTKDSSDQLKNCYARASVVPPGFLTTDTSPLLDILTGFQPRPEGVQNLKNLIYAQFDLPDLCENVCQF